MARTEEPPEMLGGPILWCVVGTMEISWEFLYRVPLLPQLFPGPSRGCPPCYGGLWEMSWGL